MDFDQLLELSPPVLLALCLSLSGVFLKKSRVQNWLIPWMLMSVGALIFPFIADVATKEIHSRNPIFYHAVIGAAIGGLSVGAHQAISQLSEFLTAKKNGLPKGDTALIKRSDENQR